MTLSEIATLCPALEGWREWSEVYPHMWSTGSPSLRAVVFVEVWTGGFRVRALTDKEDHYIFTPEAALPAAYLRALAAVGLAPDPEKEDMRRRLTWASEVPTTPGRYLVEDPDADGAILMYEFGVGGLGWVEYVPHTVRFGPLGFASDSRFLLLANLKET